MVKRTSLLILCALSAAAQSGAPLFPPAAQNRSNVQLPFGPPSSIGSQQGYFQIDSAEGPGVHFNALVEPPLSNPDNLKLGWGVFRFKKRNQDAWHRFVIDQVHRQYFGYDLAVDAPAQGRLTFAPALGPYRVTFSPLSIEPGQLQPGGLSPAPLPKDPEPQTIMIGDKIAVDLLISADGKRRIIDYIELSPPGPAQPPAAVSTGDPKDYTLDDGPVHFDFAGYVAISGRKFQGPTSFLNGKNGGATLWFSFPGQGRYILSLAPHDGLTKIGTVRDNVILFEGVGQQYEIRMQNPIVGWGAWNLYGVYDPGHPGSEVPAQMPHAGLPPGVVGVAGGTDRLENLLRN